jgi:Rod binding domain-containing protein
MNQELATQVGKDGSLGVSKMLYGQLSPAILAQAEARVRLAPGLKIED